MEKIVTTLRRDRGETFARERATTADERGPRPARDVVPGECWAFKDHRTVADLIGEGLS
jgi:hypothetical protein